MRTYGSSVVGAVKGRTEALMSTAILGRFDDRTLTWRDPPGGAVDMGVEHFRSIWTWAAEPVPNVLIPGLAWRGRVSKIAAAPKLGKTSLITNGIAAWQAGQTFLGEQTGPPGSVLYVSETGPAVLRSWFEQYGCPTDAPIIVGGASAVDTIAKSAREHKPDLVVIDSLTDLHAASDGGNLWNAGDVRKLLQPLRELECAVILVHHVRKSDGKSRDSGDFEAAPDMNVTFDPGFDYGGNVPPPGDRRLRYSGRWSEPERTLTFDNTYGYALKESTGGKGPTGEGDPFTAKGPAPTMLDTRVIDYIMQHPKSSGRKISEGIECNQRELRPALARLSVAGRIASEEGPRRSILWSVTTTSPSETTDMDGPPESSVPSVPPNEFGTLDSLGTLNKNGAERDKQNRVYPVYQTLTEGSPGTLDPLNENRGKRVEQDRADPALAVPLDSDSLAGAKVTGPPIAGGGASEGDASIDVSIPAPPGGEPSETGEVNGRLQYAPPTRHVSGTKRWDDSTGMWVDVTEADLVSLLKAGITPRVVRLDNGFTVRDGSAHIHVPSRWSNADGSGGMSLRLELVPGSESVTVN